MEGRAGFLFACLLVSTLVAPALPARADSEPPVVRLAILDPGNGFREVSTLTEAKAYSFDAGDTTDDSLNFTRDNVNLTYEWNFGDGTVLGPGLGRDGFLNISHSYPRWGEYALELTVTDASGRWATLRRLLVVQVDTALHPNLMAIPGSLVITPEQPEVGRELLVRVDVRNLRYSATAQDVLAQFAVRTQNQDNNQTVSPVRLFDSGGKVVSEISSDTVVTVEFSVVLEVGAGNHSIVVSVWDGNEPSPWWSDNRVVSRISVLPPITPTALALAAVGILSGGAIAGTFLWSKVRRHKRRDDRPAPPPQDP